MTSESGLDADSTAAPLLEARNISKHFAINRFRGGRQVVRAVDGVDLTIADGETLSIIGESGCGKSTTARMLLQLDKPTSGSVLFRGKDLANSGSEVFHEYRRNVQAVFQDPASSLNPRRRIRQLISEPLITNKIAPAREHAQIVEDLLAQVGLDPALANSHPHELSGGMRQRVAIAQALAANPSVIILDEPVSALDVSIRAQIMNLLSDIQAKRGISYVLIAHDLATVRYLSHRVLAMYLGNVVEQADTDTFAANALHPYTLSLVSAAIPAALNPERERIVLKGDPPSPTKPPTGCRFHTRCWLREQIGNPEKCVSQKPELLEVTAGHTVACHFPEESIASKQRIDLLATMERTTLPLRVIGGTA